MNAALSKILLLKQLLHINNQTIVYKKSRHSYFYVGTAVCCFLQCRDCAETIYPSLSVTIVFFVYLQLTHNCYCQGEAAFIKDKRNVWYQRNKRVTILSQLLLYNWVLNCFPLTNTVIYMPIAEMYANKGPFSLSVNVVKGVFSPLMASNQLCSAELTPPGGPATDFLSEGKAHHNYAAIWNSIILLLQQKWDASHWNVYGMLEGYILG